MKVCLVPECGRKTFGLHLCSRHYDAHRKGKNIGVTPQPQKRPNGTGGFNPKGYFLLPRMGDNTKLEHRAIVERALGRKLKSIEEVHHVDENPANNNPTNLVVCPNHSYHLLLHLRTRAYDACGHADWRLCRFCQQYSPPETMVICKRSSSFHKNCRNAHIRQQRKLNAANNMS